MAGSLALVVVAACTPPPTGGGGGTTTTTTTTIPGATTTTTPTTTTSQPGGTTTATLVSGRLHTCSLRFDATVRCWGSNASGQLGTGTTASSTIPVKVPGLDQVVSLAAGGQHTCAVKADHTVWCWGSNSDGQLGNGSLDPTSTVPVQAFSLESFTSVTAGGSHTCAIRSSSQVSCWGDNFSGQLGTGSNSPGATPRNVANLSGVTQVAAGDSHTCALLATGGVSCWGDNVNGQLGRGTFVNANVAGPVTGLSGASSVVTGAAFTCAALSSGGASCWGENLYGQLGNGAVLPPPPQAGDPDPPPMKENTPQAVGLSGVTAIGRGAEHACAVSGGVLACWGRNDGGQLARSSTVTPASSNPLAVTGATGMNQIAGGDLHTCSMRSNGTAVCWGDNTFGQLGNGNHTSTTSPVAVIAL